jgi:hypothetical protein
MVNPSLPKSPPQSRTGGGDAVKLRETIRANRNYPLPLRRKAWEPAFAQILGK